MRKKRYGWLFALACVGTLLVQGEKTQTAQALSFPLQTPVAHSVQVGGTLRTAVVSEAPFKGALATELSIDGTVGKILEFTNNDLFNMDKNYQYTKGGLANVTFDEKNKTATVKISPKAKWSDGQPLTSRDLAFSYEVVAHKESGSVSYGEALAEIEGITDYHDGKAQKISGLEEKDPQTLIVHYKAMHPAMRFVGAGYLWNTALPYHYLKDTPIKELAGSEKLQKTPLSYGPFVIKKVVAGEAVEYVRNKYYPKKPKLDKVTLEVVPVSQAATAMKAKKYDLLFEMPAEVYNKVKDQKDLTIIGKKELAYSYLGFKVGHSNDEGLSVMDKDSVVSDRNLRQALAYAMNIDQVAKKFGHGLSYRAKSIVPDAFGKYRDPELKGYPYDLKKANELLDKAGYKKQKDGYRIRPNGKPLTVRLLARRGSQNHNAIVENYIEQWKKIGVKVKLVNGRLQESNTMTNKLLSDSKGFDMWLLAWTLPPEPTADGITYLPNSQYNFGHFATKENSELVYSFTKSDKAFNEKYLLKQFYKWQAYMNKEAYIVPMQNNYYTMPVAKNVTGVSLANNGDYYSWAKVGFVK